MTKTVHGLTQYGLERDPFKIEAVVPDLASDIEIDCALAQAAVRAATIYLATNVGGQPRTIDVADLIAGHVAYRGMAEASIATLNELKNLCAGMQLELTQLRTKNAVLKRGLATAYWGLHK